VKYQYLRIDLFSLLQHGEEIKWLHTAPDCEWRDDYQCFFILKGSPTHTLAALKYGDVFD